MHFSNFNDRNLNSLDARNVEIIVHNVVKKDINRKNYMRKDKNSHQSVKWQTYIYFCDKICKCSNNQGQQKEKNCVLRKKLYRYLCANNRKLGQRKSRDQKQIPKC